MALVLIEKALYEKPCSDLRKSRCGGRLSAPASRLSSVLTRRIPPKKSADRNEAPFRKRRPAGLRAVERPCGFPADAVRSASICYPSGAVRVTDSMPAEDGGACRTPLTRRSARFFLPGDHRIFASAIASFITLANALAMARYPASFG